MKKSLIIWVIILLVILGSYLLLINFLPQKSGGKIVIKTSSAGIEEMLSKECLDDNYISENAGYIVDIKIKEINSEDDETTYLFEIVSWIKGEIPSLEITRTSSQESEDQPSFEKGKSYRLYLNKVDDNVVFVCGFRGVKDLYEV